MKGNVSNRRSKSKPRGGIMREDRRSGIIGTSKRESGLIKLDMTRDKKFIG